jgi:hypothetical protein
MLLSWFSAAEAALVMPGLKTATTNIHQDAFDRHPLIFIDNSCSAGAPTLRTPSQPKTASNGPLPPLADQPKWSNQPNFWPEITIPTEPLNPSNGEGRSLRSSPVP